MTNRDSVNFILLSSFLFFWGLWWRYLRFLPSIDAFVFGGYADGLFNLWLLEHTRNFFINWNLGDYINTKIFFPENRLVFFFSDNLIVPAIVYSSLYLLTGNMIISYNLLVYSLIAFGYLACGYLYLTIFRVSQKNILSEAKRTALVYMVPVLAYTAAFSDPRMLYTGHFQNHMANFIIVGAAFCIQYYYSERSRFLWGILMTWLILCYSAPYYALGFSILALFFGCFLLGGKGFRFVKDVVMKNAATFALIIFVSVPVLTGYFVVKDSYASQGEFQSRFWHLINPLPETFLFDLLKREGVPVRFYSHESLSYAGLFLVPFLVAAVVGSVYVVLGFRGKGGYIYVLLFLAILHTISYIGLKEFPLIAFVAFAMFLLVSLSRVISFGKGRFLWAFLFLSVCVYYGIAMGPSRAYPVEGWNPTFWGVFSEVICGFRSIRSVGRFGSIGLVFCIGLVFYLILELETNESYRKPGKVIFGVFLACIALNAIIDQTRRPYITEGGFSMVIATDAERAVFSGPKRNIFILPANNLSIIPSYMIYFEPFSSVHIINGYSGRFPKTFWKLYTRYEDSIDEEGVNFIKSLDGTDILFDKRYYREDALKEIARRAMWRKSFENSHFMLCSIAPDS